MLQGQVRIISGQWRGRKLPVLSLPGLRPTSDRVRETLFNWLMPIVQGAHCLDCFAGSGALGFEALSRHARYARFLEKNQQVTQQLTQNLRRLGTQAADVLHVDSCHYLAQPADRLFNLVFLDPPFGQALLAPTIARLEQHFWLADPAWIYLETETACHSIAIPSYWHLYREKKTCQVIYRLYIRHLGAGAESQPAPCSSL